MAKTDYKNIDQYHKAFLPEIAERMQKIRDIVNKIAPDAEELISYQIPCFKYKGYLIYYSAYKSHISLSNPFSQELLEHFKKEFTNYKVSKSAIQFPNNKPLPIKLITDIIKFRKKENEEKVLIPPNILKYNQALSEVEICNKLAKIINANLKNADNKIWHSHPVWFINGNPIVGYSKQKNGIRLMFWSGADFNESDLNVIGEKFKDASVFYNAVDEIDALKIKRWIQKSEKIQWDYKNLIKRKGKLEKLKTI